MNGDGMWGTDYTPGSQPKSKIGKLISYVSLGLLLGLILYVVCGTIYGLCSKYWF